VVRLMKRWKRVDGKIPYVVHYEGLPIKKLRRSWPRVQGSEDQGRVAAHPGATPRNLADAGRDRPWEAAGSLV